MLNRKHILAFIAGLILTLSGCNLSTAHAQTATANEWIINVQDYGADGENRDDDYAAFQAAFDFALSKTLDFQNFSHGVVLYIPAGFYDLSQAITWSGSAEAFFKLRILGDGMDQSILKSISANTDIFHLEQTGAGYIGYLMFEHLQLYYGHHAVYADNFSYSEFDHVRFRGNGLHGSDPGGPSIKLVGNTVLAHIRESNFVHGADVLEVTNGNVIMQGNTIGEDVGNIRVRGRLTAIGNYWSGAGVNKRDPAGIFGMGGAAVSVEGESSASFVGNTIGTISNAFINADQASSVSLIGNYFALSSGTIIRNRRMFGDRGITISGGNIRALGTGNIVFEGVQGYKPRNSRIDGVHIYKAGSDLAVGAGFMDPANLNSFGFNPGLDPL